VPARWAPCCAGRASTPRTWPLGDRQRKQGEFDALTAKKRGPKVVVSPLVKENRELQAANARLTKKLKNAELIIEVQKKVAALLGNPIPNIQIDEEN
jgi:regulator of replication initiation timing